MRNYDEYDKLDLREPLSTIEALNVAANLDHIEYMREVRKDLSFAKFELALWLIIPTVYIIIGAVVCLLD